MTRPDPAQIARAGEGIDLHMDEYLEDDVMTMAHHFEAMNARREAEARTPSIIVALVLACGVAIGLLLGVLICHFATVAAAAVTDPLAGMPW